MIFTSTTALFGDAIRRGACTWVDESTPPQPRSVYHRTKVAAESLLEEMANDRFTVRVVRMSRCFPEAADVMALYRLHRGVDVRDVADAHRLCLTSEGAACERYIISGATPFHPPDCDALAADAGSVLEERVPALVQAFHARGWPLPRGIDRIYAPAFAQRRLGWRPKYGYEEVLAQLDRGSLEVLPAGARIDARPE